MPTRTIDTQVFEGETIQCAKFVSDEPFSWKAAQIVQAECDYEFQMVAKSSVATSLKIQVGDVAKNQDITTDFTRFVIPFPSVTNDVDSLYITFPSGTYWLYNLQLERASTPSAWRPAPEDAEDYADKASQKAVDDQTQLDVFNKLTNNGASQGIYLLDGQLYINGEYIAANTISGNKIHGGTISGTEIDISDGIFKVDSDGKVTAANINITGGSISIRTASETTDIIELNTTYSKTLLRPSALDIMNTDQSVTYNGRQYKTVVTPSGITQYPYYNHTPTVGSGFALLGPTAPTDSSSGTLTLADGTGTTRVRLSGGASGTNNPVLQMYDKNSYTRVSLGNDSLSLNDSNNYERVKLNATNGLILRDSSGRTLIQLDTTGLSFYSSGTRTCRYNTNGTITVP